MTRAEYVTRATDYYRKRYAKVFPGYKQVLVDNESLRYFRVVQAGIMSIAPGRQNAKSRGWNEAALQAHRRAAAALR